MDHPGREHRQIPAGERTPGYRCLDPGRFAFDIRRQFNFAIIAPRSRGPMTSCVSVSLDIGIPPWVGRGVVCRHHRSPALAMQPAGARIRLDYLIVERDFSGNFGLAKDWLAVEPQTRITQLVREGSLRLSQAKLSRNSNQIARGRIRQFESYHPSQPVRHGELFYRLDGPGRGAPVQSLQFKRVGRLDEFLQLFDRPCWQTPDVPQVTFEGRTIWNNEPRDDCTTSSTPTAAAHRTDGRPNRC